MGSLHLGAQLDTVCRLGIDDRAANRLPCGHEHHVIQVAIGERNVRRAERRGRRDHQLIQDRRHAAFALERLLRDAAVHAAHVARRDSVAEAAARRAPALRLGLLLQIDEFAHSFTLVMGQRVEGGLAHEAQPPRLSRRALQPQLRLPSGWQAVGLEQPAEVQLETVAA
eukprot:scaffold3461_cov116-Isochrysis_galbana.AAC.3